MPGMSVHDGRNAQDVTGVRHVENLFTLVNRLPPKSKQEPTLQCRVQVGIGFIEQENIKVTIHCKREDTQPLQKAASFCSNIS